MSMLAVDKIDLYNQMPCYMCCRDNDGRILWGNHKVAQLAGFKKSYEIEGLHDNDAPWCDHSEKFREHDRDAYQGVIYRQLDPLVSATDGPKLILACKTPLYSDTKEVVGILALGLEINQPEILAIAELLNRTSPLTKNESLTIVDTDHLTDKLGGLKLARREFECLFYLLRGRSIKMIGKILDLSPRTVESYLNKVKAKLGCTSKDDVATGVGLMRLIPASLMNQKGFYHSLI